MSIVYNNDLNSNSITSLPDGSAITGTEEIAVVQSGAAVKSSVDDVKTYINAIEAITSTDNAVVRFDGVDGQVQDSAVYITDDGNVGIGTTSPASLLNVNATGNLRQISSNQWSDMSASGGGYAVFGSNVYLGQTANDFRYANTHGFIGAGGMAINTPSWGDVSLFASTGATTADATFTPTMGLILKPSGNVGIGKTTPASALSVAGNFGLSETGSSVDRFIMSTSPAATVFNHNDNSDMVFQLQGTEFMRLDFDSGSVGIASGLSFDGGTNIMSHYESGEFTPEFIDSDGLSTIVHDIQDGNYIRVGNLVHCWGYLSTSSVTVSGTGTLRIGGLPFTSKNNNFNYYSGSISFIQGFGTTSKPDGIFALDNTDYCWLYARAGGDARSELDIRLTVADLLTTNNTIRFAVSYEI